MAALAARGHDSRVFTLADELGHLTERGIEGFAIDATIERNQLEDWRERSPLRANVSVLRTFAERAGAEAPDLERALAHHDPEVLLIDINCWGAATAAEASGLPWALYSPYLLPLASRDTPPYGPGLAPRGGPLGAVRDRLINRIAGGFMDRQTLPTLGALRAPRGLPPLEHFSELLSRPPLLLALTAEGFEYPRRDWPANVRLVGPINWAPPQPPPAWLEQMADPLVLVTCSTERQDDRRLIDAALQALPAAGMSVIATSAAHEADAFSAPSGSKVVRFVDHDAVLRRAACVICHGGMGITQKALAAGVPVVVVPFGRDQLETARRVEVAAAGVRLAPRRLTPERLARAVGTALGRRAGAQRVSRAFAAAGGAVAAADAIEALGRVPGSASSTVTPG